MILEKIKQVRKNRIRKNQKIKFMKPDVPKKKSVKKQAILLLVASIFLPGIMNAQPYPPPPDLGDGQVYDVPLDDNIYLLIIVAVIYGIFRIWSDRKAKKQAAISC